ncbi:uncharacterized protein TNCV_3706191 [Trichonephila clavipes]|nr:uncharacterized protein TNCV_3706191 [Trichonephila clavipes]
MCLRHSFYKILKSHVLVSNYSPFQQWPLIDIDNDGFPKEHNPGQRPEIIQRNDEYDQTERYLIANFGNARILSADMVHTSGWRRVFVDNLIDFSCTDSSTAAYVREQKKRSKLVHVFKEIFRRERGETINHFRILEFIASPYYYVLPHHSEARHDGTNNISDSSLKSVSGDLPAQKVMIYFESQLRIAKKNTARLN